MDKINTFVVIDLETTGLPHQEYNSTKITSICLISTTRRDMRHTEPGKMPTVSKLSYMLNPEKNISAGASNLTGITNELVKHSPTFKDIFNTIKAYLEGLKKPVCLVAHNGYNFDYKILLAECKDARVSLPNDLLCMDSLAAFRKLYKLGNVTVKVQQKNANLQVKKAIQTPSPVQRVYRASTDSVDSMNHSSSDIMTDDEESSDEDAAEIESESAEHDWLDDIFNNVSPSTTAKNNVVNQNAIYVDKRVGFKLTDIYGRYFGSVDKTAHRAEDDCLMLLQCMVAAQSVTPENDIVKWADENSKLLSEIPPLMRKNRRY